jgi:hypothetical protein
MRQVGENLRSTYVKNTAMLDVTCHGWSQATAAWWVLCEGSHWCPVAWQLSWGWVWGTLPWAPCGARHLLLEGLCRARSWKMLMPPSREAAGWGRRVSRRAEDQTYSTVCPCRDWLRGLIYFNGLDRILQENSLALLSNESVWPQESAESLWFGFIFVERPKKKTSEHKLILCFGFAI